MVKLKTWYLGKGQRTISDKYRKGWDKTFRKRKIFRPIKDENGVDGFRAVQSELKPELWPHRNPIFSGKPGEYSCPVKYSDDENTKGDG